MTGCDRFSHRISDTKVRAKIYNCLPKQQDTKINEPLRSDVRLKIRDVRKIK